MVPSFPSLSQTFILDQVTGLIDLGHDVDIISCYKPQEAIQHEDVARYGLLDRVRYLGIPESAPARAARGVLLLAGETLRSPRQAFDSINIRSHGRAALTFNLAYAARLASFQTDVLYCHFGTSGIIGEFLLSNLATGKLVVCFHAYDLTVTPRLFGRKVYENLFRRADLVQAISEHGRGRLEELGCPDDLIAVQPMGIHVERFRFRERKILPGEKLRLLTIGRLVEKKGIEFGIRAVARVAGEGLQCEYFIAGDGRLRGDLERLVSSLGLSDTVHLLGPVEQNKAIELYNDCHVFLLPSVTAGDGDQEGLPVVLMEAEACGMPVISTFHAGIPEAVADGKSGFLVHERDVSAIADKIRYLATHAAEWGAMGMAGRRIIESGHDSAILADKLEQTFLELIQDH
ncbi:MAG: glycosyltransferase [Candidatus Geothermincolia bacterium]